MPYEFANMYIFECYLKQTKNIIIISPVNLALSSLTANYALLLFLDVSRLQKYHMASRQQKHHCATRGSSCCPRGSFCRDRRLIKIVVVAAVLKITRRNTGQLASTESSYHYDVQTTDTEDMAILNLPRGMDCNQWPITCASLQKYWNNKANSFVFSLKKWPVFQMNYFGVLTPACFGHYLAVIFCLH